MTKYEVTTMDGDKITIEADGISKDESGMTAFYVMREHGTNRWNKWTSYTSVAYVKDPILIIKIK